ncbi:hypothetical protein Ancab_023283 [Ancistrocladus abbreviatus]
MYSKSVATSLRRQRSIGSGQTVEEFIDDLLQKTPILRQGEDKLSWLFDLSDRFSSEAVAMVACCDDTNPLVAETVAFQYALELVGSHNTQAFIVKGDCQVVIQSINIISDPPWKVKHLIQQIHSLLSKMDMVSSVS